jgi:hypothetical protein
MVDKNKEEIVMDIEEFDDVLDQMELPEIDMTTYDQADNENNGCTGGGCAI